MLRSLMIVVLGGVTLLGTVVIMVLLVPLEPTARFGLVAALAVGVGLLTVGGVGFARTSRSQSRTQATAMANLQRKLSLLESEIETHQLRAAEQQREHLNRVAALQTRMLDRLERVSATTSTTPRVHS